MPPTSKQLTVAVTGPTGTFGFGLVPLLQAEERIGRWSPEILNAAIAEHRWSMVVLSYKFLPADSLAVLEREYEQTDGLASPNGFSYFVYRPRPAS